MKEPRSNGLFLIVIALLFGISVAILPIRTSKASSSNNDIDNAKMSAALLTEDSLDKAIIYVRPLIATGSIGTLAQALKGVPLERVIELADYIIEKESLSTDQELLFLLALTFNYQDDIDSQYEVLNRIVKFDQLQENTPPLLVAARSSEFNGAIPTVLSWAEKQNLSQQFIDDALAAAVKDNDRAALQKLVELNMPITKEQASQNLLTVVKENKDIALVPFFVEHGADVDLVDNKRTLLIYATENNNVPMVQALLKAGADAKKFADSEVGTPLQIAIEKRYADIDVLLREHGAIEK